MTTPPILTKLLRFTETAACASFFAMATESFFEEFTESYDLEDPDDLVDTIGDVAVGQLFPCLFDFFCSNEYRDEGKRWNVIDLFLKKRGTLLKAADKSYLRSLRHSYMSLYEVLDITPDESILLKDVIGGGEPVRVFEKLLTRQIAVWDIIGGRLLEENGRFTLAGGALKLERKTAQKVAEQTRTIHEKGMKAMRSGALIDPEQADYTPAEQEHLFKVQWAKEIALGYMEDCVRKNGQKIVFKNTEGDLIKFHTMTYPLKADWLKIAEKIQTVPDYHQDEDSQTRKFWNLVCAASPSDETKESEIQEDGTLVQIFDTTLSAEDMDTNMRVLGTIELTQNELIAQGNSENRAKALEARLVSLLGDQIGAPVWRIKTMEEALDNEDFDEDEDENDDGIDLSPEQRTEILHTALTDHYRGWLTSSIPMLDGKTPKQVSKTKEGREKLVDALKDIENSVRHIERQNKVTRPLDLSWMWEELGLSRDKAA